MKACLGSAAARHSALPVPVPGTCSRSTRRARYGYCVATVRVLVRVPGHSGCDTVHPRSWAGRPLGLGGAGGVADHGRVGGRRRICVSIPDSFRGVRCLRSARAALICSRSLRRCHRTRGKSPPHDPRQLFRSASTSSAGASPRTDSLSSVREKQHPPNQSLAFVRLPLTLPSRLPPPSPSRCPSTFPPPFPGRSLGFRTRSYGSFPYSATKPAAVARCRRSAPGDLAASLPSCPSPSSMGSIPSSLPLHRRAAGLHAPEPQPRRALPLPRLNPFSFSLPMPPPSGNRPLQLLSLWRRLAAPFSALDCASDCASR